MTAEEMKAYPLFGDYDFKTDEKSLKEFEEELGIERKHIKLPWEENNNGLYKMADSTL